MTAPTITAPQLALARNAAQAALAVLPTSRELAVAAPIAATVDVLPEGQAVTAKFSGAANGEVVVVVGQDLADALKESPLGELDLTAAVRPALEAAARVFGPVVLDPGVVMEPGVALSALAAKDDAVVVPLVEGEDVRAVLALALSPWPAEETGQIDVAAPRESMSPAMMRGGLDMLHDVEMEVPAKLARTRMNVPELVSLIPGAVLDRDPA